MQYAKVPISAQQFPSSDWCIFETLIIHVVDVLEVAESKSEAKFGEQAIGKISI